MKTSVLFSSALLAASLVSCAQKEQKMKPEETEVWEPVPAVVTPGTAEGRPPVPEAAVPGSPIPAAPIPAGAASGTAEAVVPAPSDAIVLFNGKDLNQWESVDHPGSPAPWTIEGNTLKVNKGTGNIQTKRSFTDYQLHLEWRVPADITGSGQARGNSGLFLASTGKGDDGYELQILDSYNNKTYVNGQAGSVYKQTPPLVNACRPPGEWQSYDVIWTAPRFNSSGSLLSPARITAFHNGILIQNNTELAGPTQYIGKPAYPKAHGPCPIKLQAHGDESEPLSFRNIWVREL